jgi:hypothetical protein
VDGPALKLPERFVSHGVIGRGSQAVVLLVTDTVRRERVALKVFHAHALGEAGEQRLRREVKAASLVRSDAALLPFDVHAFDGVLALSMPFHPGRTLADRVQDSGRLSPAAARVLAGRLLQALAAAHGAGVLHRDVSPNNVLLSEDVRDAVLADFGSARPIGATATRSAMTGTLGYVAPEVLAGRRAEVRSDLYGLGAVLYLAATGHPVAEGQGGLAAQLAGRFVPVRERAADVPEDLAVLIERLLAADPEARPDGAAECLGWLNGAGPSSVAVEAELGPRQFLPSGRSVVVVEERSRDRRRRSELRKQFRTTPAPGTAWEEVSRWGRHVADRLRENLGVPAAGQASPESQLVAAVAAEAGVPAALLRASPVLWRKRFRLVERVERACAERLAESARLAGFQVKVTDEAVGWNARVAVGLLVALATGGWGFTLAAGLDPTVAILLTVAAVVFGQRMSRGADPEAGPPAYDVDLAGMLQGAATPKFARAGAKPKVVASSAPAPRQGTRGERLRASAVAALEALGAAARSTPDLPGPFRDDLLGRVKELTAEAAALGQRVDDLERQLTSHGAAPGEVERLVARLERTRALARSGDRVSDGELAALERALAQHRADEEAGAVVESLLAAGTAQLLEIASTASRVRRELSATGPAPAKEVVGDLSRQVDAMRRARREAEGVPPVR